MQPFKRWLACHASADALRRELEKSSAQFRQYIEAAQIGARESTRQTGGFTEMLAEPFQRVSRYRLMLDREWLPKSRAGIVVLSRCVCLTLSL